jgi:hypothetical protein
MIRIGLNDDDLSRTRLAISPLWELIASLIIVADEHPAVEYVPWVTRARRAPATVEPGPLDLDSPLGHYLPDFVAPTPAARLGERFAARPRQSLDRLCDWLHLYWGATLAPA